MIKTLKDIDVEGKKVLVRADFNVVGDDSKIVSTLPTINYLLERNCKVILASHLGRPKGKVVDEFRLDDVAKRLSKRLGLKVRKLDETVGADVSNAVAEMKKKEVILLENVQFNPGEINRDPEFAKKLAGLADVFVLDAFGQSHRDYASLTMVQNFIPSCAGLLLEKELEMLGSLMSRPEKPFVAVLGGAKISDKLLLVKKLLEKADRLIIGGAMAFTFIKGKGHNIGKSLVEDGFVSEAHKLLKTGKIVLPVDVIEADSFKEDAKHRIVPIDRLDNGYAGLDIGPESIKLFRQELEKASTIVWNGPMGVFEFDNFAKGTEEIARHIAKCSATTVIGGGDTLSAAKKAGVEGKFSHTSTGGGAMLEFLEGKKLPAIEALDK